MPSRNLITPVIVSLCLLNSSATIAEEPPNPEQPKKNMAQVILQGGDRIWWTGVTGVTVQKQPPTNNRFCDEDISSNCGIGIQTGLEWRRRSSEGAHNFSLTRLTLDGADDFTTALFAKGYGLGLDAHRVLGASVEMALGVGLTQLRVNRDKSYHPTGEFNIALTWYISRFVTSFGGNYRRLMNRNIDGEDYGPEMKGLYLSWGISF